MASPSCAALLAACLLGAAVGTCMQGRGGGRCATQDGEPDETPLPPGPTSAPAPEPVNCGLPDVSAACPGATPSTAFTGTLTAAKGTPPPAARGATRAALPGTDATAACRGPATAARNSQRRSARGPSLFTAAQLPRPRHELQLEHRPCADGQLRGARRRLQSGRRLREHQGRGEVSAGPCAPSGPRTTRPRSASRRATASFRRGSSAGTTRRTLVVPRLPACRSSRTALDTSSASTRMARRSTTAGGPQQ